VIGAGLLNAVKILSEELFIWYGCHDYTVVGFCPIEVSGF